MAVIYVPEDKRWSAIGQGLGALAGNVAGAYAQRSVDSGVAAIQQDPNLDPQQKLTTIQQKYGREGLLALNNQLKTRMLEQQIGNLVQTHELTGQQIQQLKDKNLVTESTMDQALLKPKLENEAAKADIALRGAQTTATQEEIPLRQAQTEEVKQRTALTGAETGLKSEQLDAIRRFNSSGVNLGDTFKELGLTPEQVPVAKAAYVGAGGGLAGMKAVSAYAEKLSTAKAAAETRENQPKQTPEAQMKVASSAAELATATTNFMKAFEENPQTGTASATPVKAWLEKHGFSTGDPGLLTMYENSLQQIGLKATAGGGFFSQGRVNLAKDLTPNLNRSPLGNIIATDSIADTQLAALRTQKLGLTANQNSKPLDSAIEQWEGIKKDTGTLQSYIDKGGHSVVYYKGNQVDPKTLKPTLEGQKQYSLGKGTTVSGATIMAKAMEQKISPEQLLAALKAHYGGEQ